MGKGNNFFLLLWKNYLIQKRKVFLTVLEIALPTFFALLLIVIRHIVHGTPVNNVTTWSYCDISRMPPSEHFLNPLPKKLAYSPDKEATRRIMSALERRLPGIQADKSFNKESQLVDFLLNHTTEYLGGIVFTSRLKDKGSNFTTNITYKIRLSSAPRNAGKQKFSFNPSRGDKRWNTKMMFPLFQRVGPREKNFTCGGAPGYYREGFLALQNAVNYALFEDLAPSDTVERIKETNISVRRHPYPHYNDDYFILVLQQQFPLILILSFIVMALSIVKDIVHEKERKLKESMKMMGMNNWLHWMAWFVKYFMFSLISIILMTVFFSIHVDSKSVIGKTDPFLLFIFLVIYSISIISFCFMVSVFFAAANSAAAAGGILFFCFYIPYFFIQPRYDTMSWMAKMAACLDFQVAMAFGGQVIGMFEGTGSGIQWDNFQNGVSVDDNFALIHVFIMLLVDSFIYGVITWYIEAVFPGDYGVPQPFYFPLTCTYWCGSKPTELVVDDKTLSIGQDPDLFEKDPVGVRAGIRIRNLRKEFRNGGAWNIAVAGMTMDMYEGQITALLGHNGAGKTTTMSMLTGFIPTSGGTAFVNGYDIRHDISSVRNSLGLCPQHDVLFDTLTVEEHLKFFAKLKGVKHKELSAEIDEMLVSVGLMEKRKAQSKTLSGGMKRKLSVAIALIGGSKVVILDEPSSGMDPDARRHIWTVLQNNRAGRTMVLTTHFMDEADLLGDRIAIMADGVVKCCGSSLFLKHKYGAGYHMIIVKESHCDVDKLTELVKHYAPQAEIESNVGAELTYILPRESCEKFEMLFTDLERDKNSLGIASFGASVTTMEEVFLRVGENNDHHLQERLKRKREIQEQNGAVRVNIPPNSDIAFDLTVNGAGSSEELDMRTILNFNSGFYAYLQQFGGTFLKRMRHTFRNKLVTASQLVVPLFFTIMALVVIKTFPGPEDSPPLKLSIKDYHKNFIAYSTPVSVTSELKALAQTYKDQFVNTSSEVTYINSLPQFKTDPDIIKYLAMKAEEGIGIYNLKFLVAADFQNQSGTDINATAYFNNQAYHSPAISLAELANAVLRFVTNKTAYNLEVTNHPLPRTVKNKIDDELSQGTTGFTVAFNICFGMSFLASSFVLFLIKERTVKSKHIQFVSGARASTYWLATFLWDMINFLIPCILLIITFAGFTINPYIDNFHWASIFLLFFMYGWAMLPFMYLLSFLFQVPSTGYVWVTMFNLLTGVATVLIVGIMSIPQLDLQDVSRTLEWIFLVLLPNFCLGEGLEDFYDNYQFLKLCEVLVELKFCDTIPLGQEFPCCKGKCGDTCVDFNTNYLGWEANGIGRMLVFLAIQGTVFFFFVFLIESEVLKTFFYIIRSRVQSDNSKPGVWRQLSRSDSRVQEDSDVATERARLANTTLLNLFKTDKLILREVTKDYGTLRAVEHISVGIPRGECFGLLGVNGAGKTTTFKMLTGDEILNDGDAYLDGFSVKSEIKEVQQRLGYCPQFDALIGQLTGRETLYLYARLRGVSEKQIPDEVENLIQSLLLKEHADKLTRAYSGGNKRKLSTAIALVGNPPIIFLDEPTTGMDPVARRLLWDALATVRDTGRTLVLTSHSMEECEALCTRLAIMVNGQFKCLGSPQHLKNKFGDGYTLIAKVSYPEGDREPDLQPLMNFIEDTFPGSILKDVHQCMLHYHITDRTCSWAQLFGTMERAKITYNIEDYLVSQTTLEQVFINFARAQLAPTEPQKGCFRLCC